MEALIAALKRELDLTAEEIADILWLASIRYQFTSRLASDSQANSPRESNATNLIEPKVITTERERLESASASLSKHPQPNQEIGLFPKPSKPKSEPAATLDTIPFKVSNPPSIRDPLNLVRSLRPLIQKVPSQTEATIDEIKTAQKIAEEKIWFPVTTPVLESWLDLALVVDESSSMLIWRQTILELQKLFKNYGIFRDVQTWGLLVDKNDQIGIRPGFGSLVTGKLHSPQELIDPSGRRLILVVTDCVSSIWQTRKVLPTLKLWSDVGPIALVQMLPEWLWVRTSLKQASLAHFYGLSPGMPNQHLSVIRRFPLEESETDARQKEVRLPIFTLEPEIMSAWSQMVAGKGNVQVPGYIFQLDRQSSATASKVGEQTIQRTPEQQVQRFRVASSPMARRLAGLLAASPVITLPVIRLIQETLLPKSKQVNVAEVLLGGILKPKKIPEPKTNPDEIEYAFVDNKIRYILLESTPVPDTVNVLSNYIKRQFNKSLDEFIADLRVWIESEDEALVERSRPFAMVSAEVLKRKGGRYAEFVREVEGLYEESEVAEIKQKENPESEPKQSKPETKIFTFEEAIVVFEDEAELAPSIDLQPFEFEVATLNRDIIGFINDLLFARKKYYLNDIQIQVLREALNNQTYQEIANTLGYNPSAIQKVASELWKLLSEIFDTKVTKTSLKSLFVNGELVIHRTRQQAWGYSEDLGNNVQLEMVAIPEGSFMMGSPEDEEGHNKSESPQQQVTLKSFFMGKYPVTQAQWRAVAALPQINRELDPDPSRFKGSDRPVESISWLDAVEFCDRLSQHTGKPYRLPSEAEWEYACRAGTITPFHFGETITTDLANYNGDYTYGAGSKGIDRKETTPVGSFGVANAFGLYDMHGNVYEWCADRWHSNYEGAPDNGSAWDDTEQSKNENYSKIRRVLRGGSWIILPNSCRSAYRNSSDARLRSSVYGFRARR